jgi:hypothetical protein
VRGLRDTRSIELTPFLAACLAGLGAWSASFRAEGLAVPAGGRLPACVRVGRALTATAAFARPGRGWLPAWLDVSFETVRVLRLIEQLFA